MKKEELLHIQEYELTIVLWEEERGFIANCPMWEDCYAQGDTVEDVISEISSVAVSLIEIYKEEHIQIPLKLKSTKERLTRGFAFNFPLIVSSK